MNIDDKITDMIENYREEFVSRPTTLIISKSFMAILKLTLSEKNKFIDFDKLESFKGLKIIETLKENILEVI